ncbi:MAG: tRNA (adenosine(37)-N6)-threonylcarbamoyltransferase complex transferase subunit TsaD [Treponematales bacterium]
MKVLGIETSCDECAAAVVEDGRLVLSNVVATQIPFHAAYRGVVPEIASRKHTEWIDAVTHEALRQARLAPADIDAVAVTSRPGLLGSLLVGLTFAKAFAWALGVPFITVDHMLAHLYASRLVIQHEEGSPTSLARLPPGAHDVAPPPFAGAPPPPSLAAASRVRRGLFPGTRVNLPAPRGTGENPPGGHGGPDYPFLGLLVSGGHTIICRADDFDNITVLGASVDDAAGEAFDKVAKHYGFGYPGGAAIDKLAETGDSEAFNFPVPNLEKKGREHRCDVSYSGLKTAVINQLAQFARPGLARSAGAAPPAAAGGAVPSWTTAADIAASFQKAAVDILLRSLFRAVEDSCLTTIVAGGGVAANSRLRAALAARKDLTCVFPPPDLCGDNGAMVAGIGFRCLERGDTFPFTASASARVAAFKRHGSGG